MTGSARTNRLVLRLIVGALAIGSFGLTAPMAVADAQSNNPIFGSSGNQSSNPLHQVHRPSLIAIPGRGFTANGPTLHAVESVTPSAQPNLAEVEAPAPTPRPNPAEVEAPTPKEVPAERARRPRQPRRKG